MRVVFYVAEIIFQFVLLLFVVLIPSRVEGEESALVLGLLMELSGDFAPNGDDCRHGYEVAQANYLHDGYAGKHRLRLVFADSRGDGRTAMSEFRRLLDGERAVAVISNRSAVVMALNPLSRREGVALLGIAGHSDFVRQNPNAVRFFPSASQETDALVSLAISEGARRFAMITAQDEWNVSLSTEFSRHVLAKGGRVVFDQQVSPSEADFYSLIARLKQKDPDIIYVNLGISQTGEVMRRIREQGMRQQIMSTFWAGKREAISLAGKSAAEGVIFVEPNLQREKFLASLQSLYGNQHASAVTYSCYAAAAAAIQAIAQLPDGEVTKTALNAALAQTNEVSLLDEQLLMRGREASFQLEYKTVHEGAVVVREGVLQLPNHVRSLALSEFE